MTWRLCLFFLDVRSTQLVCLNRSFSWRLTKLPGLGLGYGSEGDCCSRLNLLPTCEQNLQLDHDLLAERMVNVVWMIDLGNQLVEFSEELIDALFFAGGASDST